MINTIFYFAPDSFDENVYRNGLDTEDGVSSRTIVFAPAQQAIYKGGIKYTGKSIGGGSGTGGDSGGTVDTEIIVREVDNEITKLLKDSNELAESERTRLALLIALLHNKIQSRFEAMLKDAQWVQDNFDEDVIRWRAGWDDKLRQFMSRVGLWETSDGATKTKWSTLVQKYDTLSANVAALTQQEDMSSALEAWLNLHVNEVAGIVENELATSYTLADDTEKVLKWLYSGLTQLSTANMTMNDLVSAVEDGDITAISELRTIVETINDNYVSTASLTAAVNNAITGVVGTASDSSAGTTIYSKVNKNTSDIATLKVATDNATSLVELATSLGNMQSGLVLKSTFDSAIAGLLASNGLTKASVIAAINGNTSSVTIDAANIDITGLINYLRAGSVKFGTAGHFGFEFAPGGLGGGSSTALFGGMFDQDGDLVTPQFLIYYNDNNAYLGPEIELTGGGETSWITGNAGLLRANIINGKIYNNDFDSRVELGNATAADIWRYATHGNTTTKIWGLTTDTTVSGYLCPKLQLFKMSESNFSTSNEIELDTVDGSVSASGFKVSGKDDTYVLLAGGGTAALSSLGGGSSSWNGGTIGGYIGIQNNGSTGNDILIEYEGTANSSTSRYTNGKLQFTTTDYSSTLGASSVSFADIGGNDDYTASFSIFGINLTDGNGTSALSIDTASSDFISAMSIVAPSVQQGSDMTKKDVVADTTLTVDQIADAPSIQFTWKTDANKVNHVGTSAQYWQEVMPEVVNEHNDSLYMDYASTAVVSAITIAKEVVALKEEIAQLKQQIAELKGNNA